MKEQLKNLVSQLKEAEIKVEHAEEALRQAKEDYSLLSEQIIPDTLENLGLSEFTTEDGQRVVVQDVIRASPPVDRRAEAMEWLTKFGATDIIKTNVVVSFNRGDIDEAHQLQEELLCKGQMVRFDEKVEPQTMSAWVREQLENGVDIPLDLFNVRQFKQTKIKKARKN